MADLKISQLSDGGASQATDEYVVARSGANYRIDGASVAAAATSVGTLSSLTISGDLTVDTSTLKVDSANNRVGIGTATPSYPVHIVNNGSSALAVRVYDTGANASYLALNASNTDTAIIANGTAAVPLDFYTGGSARMRLDASGNLGVGLTSPGRRLSVSATVPHIQLCNSTTGTSAGDGFELAVANSDAYIIQRENAPMLFYTNDTERARITAGGDFCVNATSGNGKITVEVPDGTTNAFYAARTGGSPATLDLDFANAYVNWNASVRYQIVSGGSGGVYLDSTATSWTAVSDERFKTDLTPIADAVTKVNTLRAVTGRYITDDEAKSRAFLIAQDVQAVLPEAVSDSDPDCLGLSYTDVVPLLVAAIKELTARLEALEA